MKRRVLALLLVMVMVFSLSACSKSGSTDETTTGTTDAATGTTETTAAEAIKQTGTVADYSEYVTIGDYTGLDVAVDAAVVTDDQIQEYKDSVVYYYNNYVVQAEQITEGTVAEGDVINLDFTGMQDGVAFDGGSATGASYTAGSGSFIEDLDTQLIGLEVGKEYELLCTFPEVYPNNPDLAGQEVTFVVTVNYIEGDKTEYEYGDELVSLYSEGEFTNTADFESSFTADLLAEAEAAQQDDFRYAIWDAIVANCEVKSLPEDKVASIADDYYNYYVEYFTYYASLYSLDYESFLSTYYSMTDDDLKAECQTMAESEVTYIIVACEIFKALGRTLTDEEYSAMATETAAEYGYASAAEFVADYGEDYVRESFIFDLVNEYLIENNNMLINE